MNFSTTMFAYSTVLTITLLYSGFSDNFSADQRHIVISRFRCTILYYQLYSL